MLTHPTHGRLVTLGLTGMAKALGMEAFRISEASELKTKLSSAFSAPGPKLIEVMVDGSL